MADQDRGFTIKAVSERTGVSGTTLRAWERRYGIPNPSRNTANRYRLYDDTDIADVLWLKHQIESGLSPALASALWHQQRSQPSPVVLAEGSQPLAVMRAALENALATSDEANARQVLDQAFAMFTPEQIALQIIEPAMHELGARWQRNELGVWQEHLASNLIRQRILSYMQAQPQGSVASLSLVAACAPEEQHEIGLMLFSLLARRRGWQVAYLGQRTPLRDLVPFAKQNRRIAVSVTTAFGLSNLIPLLGGETLPRKLLLFGGYLPNQLPRLQEHLPGVFLGTNAQEAVQTLSTREPGPNLWTPPQKALRAALSLQNERLRVAWRTLAEVTPARTSIPRQQEWVEAQSMTMPTLFLIDLLSGGLAFDVPELVDAQGFWLTQMLAPRGVSAQQLKRYLAIFARVVRRTLDNDTARSIVLLLERLNLDFVLSPAANEQVSKVQA